MQASELLQFLACKTFEKPSPFKEAGASKKVLIVNDDEPIRIGLKWQIKSIGDVQIFEAGSVDEAKKIITDNNIDVILSDINMGKDQPSGYDFLESIKNMVPGSEGAWHQRAKFFFVSGYSTTTEGPKAKSLGAYGYLQLPVGDDLLHNILHSADNKDKPGEESSQEL